MYLFLQSYISVSSIIYISFFNHIYVSFCKLPYVFCKDIDKKRNYRLLFYILDRFKLILLNVCYIKLLFRFSAAHLWHNMFAIKHVWMQTCLIANTFVPVGRNLSQLAEWNARCSSHHGDVFIGKVGREYGLVHTQPVGLGSIWSYFIFIIRKETNTQRQKLMENFGSDLIPYVRYSQASIILLYLTAGLLPVAILFNTLLYIIGPLMLLSVIFFVHTFIAMGYYVTGLDWRPAPHATAQS